MKELIESIAKIKDCMVLPANGLPLLSAGHVLPDDVREFYSLCGGVKLFCGAQYSIDVVSPHDFVLANPVIVGELCEGDRSSEWYIIAKADSDQIISIDLSKDRLGHCYDSFFDRHGIVGSCSIVARSFTEFLTHTVRSEGRHWYWLDRSFTRLGDAYD